MNETRLVLQDIISSADLSADAIAAALDIDPEVFAEMLVGQREIPLSLIPLLSAILGVHERILTSAARRGRNSDAVPAIWYKMRSDRLKGADREYVLAVRQLAFYQHELELITDSRAVGWKAHFDEFRRQTDPQASPTEQGRQAARLFRRSTGLDQAAIGIGEVFRGNLRNLGILVIESSAPDSVLEGCSFYVGPSGAERPAIFANSYRTTWFRRNQILMHEFAHAIFDVESAIATLDYIESDANGSVEEQRADAFAQEALLPIEVLRNVAQRHHVRLDDDLTAAGVAALVAATHVEQRLLVKALFDSSFISYDAVERLNALDIAQELRQRSHHALTTAEFVKTMRVEGGFRRRITTTAPRSIMLPVKYVAAVLKAIQSQIISRRKAARMLMIDEYDFIERFGGEQYAYPD